MKRNIVTKKKRRIKIATTEIITCFLSNEIYKLLSKSE